MPLVDRTNEEIFLNFYGSDASMVVDVDADSSIATYPWVHISYQTLDYNDEEGHVNLTFDEARLLRDRLNLILGE